MLCNAEMHSGGMNAQWVNVLPLLPARDVQPAEVMVWVGTHRLAALTNGLV